MPGIDVRMMSYGERVPTQVQRNQMRHFRLFGKMSRLFIPCNNNGWLMMMMIIIIVVVVNM